MYHMWICNTGACGHYYASHQGTLNIQEINHSIRVVTSEIKTATNVGKSKISCDSRG
jgi:hypothetical protein